MSGTGLIALLDDVATLLDDVGAVTKLAAKKTAGVVGDDLAVGAEQVASINLAAREIPIVRKVAIGSLKNKAILIPALMGISALASVTGLPLIPFLLIVGGGYLCYEGYEKVFCKEHEEKKDLIAAARGDSLETFESEKIKGAIRTDFVLSAEIMVITLGIAAGMPIVGQLAVLATVGFGITVAVYGLVAGIVKLDDVGLFLSKKEGNSIYSKAVRGLGHAVLKGAPILMKGLSIAGTGAMFLVGGGILMHYAPGLSDIGHHLSGIVSTLVDVGAGGLAGLIIAKSVAPVVKIASACSTLARKSYDTIKVMLGPRAKKARPVANTVKVLQSAERACALSTIKTIDQKFKDAVNPATGNDVTAPVSPNLKV